MAKFAAAVQYELPIKVIIIKNNTLGMIRWEQMAFLGNPECQVESTPIDFAKFADACGSKGYSITEPTEINQVKRSAMREKKPTIVEANVDPFKPPMPPKVRMDFVANISESIAKGQPYAGSIGLTLFRDKVHEALRKVHPHETDPQ